MPGISLQLGRKSSWLGALLMLAGALAALPSASSAATLSGTVTSGAPSNVNLTTEGTIDWAIWDYQTSATGTSGAPSNRKSGGTAISNATAALGTPRGITGTSAPPTYTYTNGTSPVSATNATIGAVTDTTLNTVGAGFKLSITGNPATTETVKLYVDGFNAIGTLMATLNGATTYVDSTASYGSSRSGAVYTLTFQPNAAADLLQVSYTIGTLNAGGNANVDLQAVSVGVPEPTALGLLGIAGLALLRRRRRA